ncbi:Uncharacterised protein [Actinobaculum suis]|uniref:Uncharacterized protein n=1 Tax=Actinobaculum suis TaxID=1657 RepID=A0A7Z9C8A9_9ACTO|nr:hypothetical protein [Actinobaculum suis]VDG76169.1 Uncharacterised protein [Actinobaculum suis]
MGVKIEAPIPGYSGTTQFGTTVAAFVDGVATVAELAPGVREYLERAGYVVTDAKPEAKRATRTSKPATKQDTKP